MNSTSVWVPILSAVAALLGAGAGATLQGRYGVTGWRRQIRLDAYTKLLDATHDFDYLLFDILNTISKSDFDRRQKGIQESYTRLQSAGTLVAIAGPKRVDNELTSIMKNGREVIDDLRDLDTFTSIVHDWRKDRSYDKWTAWIESAEQFTDTARRILKTE